MPSPRGITVFSGGSAANSLVDVFESVRRHKDCPLSYIIPISDNGGSSSELIRVFGGPGIGDVRSRLVRLIPRLPPGSSGEKEREAIKTLFNHRLSSTDARAAKFGWSEIVDGTSDLWKEISSAKKELIRSILILVNSEILKRSRPPSSTFDFTSASVGNLFLTGARIFSGSFESAIYLLGSICGVPDEEVKVIPSINSNFSHHIAAGLERGMGVIVGQNAISHPSPEVVNARKKGSKIDGRGRGDTTITQHRIDSMSGRTTGEDQVLVPNGIDGETFEDDADADEDGEYEEEDANLPGTLPTLRTKNINFNKEAHLNEELPARISRVWYINPYGQEILPPANPRAISAINNSQAIIYSIGSLYTSIVPSLVLRGIGEALRKNRANGTTVKILILNGCLDREVGPLPPHPGSEGRTFSAIDFVEAIVKAGEQSRGIEWEPQSRPWLGSSNAPTESESARPTRPGMLQSKSDYAVPTIRSSKQTHPSYALRAFDTYPPPLPASTMNSAMPSREPSLSPPLTPSNGRTQPDSTQTQTAQSSKSNTPPPILLTRPTVNFPSTIPKINSTISATKPSPSPSEPDPIYNSYITHIIHLPNSPYTPQVDKSVLLKHYGIQCVKIYGRSSPANPEEGMRYDAQALAGAIEAILGRRAEKSSVNLGSPRTDGGRVFASRLESRDNGGGGGVENMGGRGTPDGFTGDASGNSSGAEGGLMSVNGNGDSSRGGGRVRSGLGRRNTVGDPLCRS